MSDQEQEGREPQPESQQEAEARYEDESRRDRMLRYGHRTSLYVSLGLGIVAAILLILLIARNTRQVKLDYVFANTHTRLVWLIVISAIAGWVLGIITAFLIRRRTRGPG